MRYTKPLIAIVVVCAVGAVAAFVEIAPAAPSQRNIVCERVALKYPGAPCTPEMSGAGEHAAHSARVGLGSSTLACALNESTLSVVCDELFAPPKAASGEGHK